MVLKIILLLILWAVYPSSIARAQIPDSIEGDVVELARKAHLRVHPRSCDFLTELSDHQAD